MLANAAASTALAPPADTSIVSLYLTSVPESHNDTQHLTDFITPLLTSASSDAAAEASSSSSSTGLRGVVPIPATNCAFINFKTRQDAENVAQQLAMRNIGKDSKKVIVSFGEEEVGVQWGRSKKVKKGPAPAGNGIGATEEKQETVAA